MHPNATWRTPPPWEDPAWNAEVAAWMEGQLAQLGLQQTGPMEPRARPWSIVERVPTSNGAVWFKTTAPAMPNDAGLTRFLSEHAPHLVLRPLAVDADRGWMILPDYGVRLRDQVDADTLLAHWQRILPSYAQLQRSVEQRQDELLGSGARERRPPQLVTLLAGLMEDRWWLRVDEPDGLSTTQLARLEALLPGMADAAAELAEAPIWATIQHDDLHDANVLIGEAGYRIIDWGDAGLAHPFATLLVTMRSISDALGLGDWTPFGVNAPQLEPLMDAYLEAWTDELPRGELNRIASLATWTGMVSRALAWRGALPHASQEELAQFGDAIPAWLAELAATAPGAGSR